MKVTVLFLCWYSSFSEICPFLNIGFQFINQKVVNQKVYKKMKPAHMNMALITLEQLHEDIIGLKKEMEQLKECFHEDFLPLSEETKKDIEESRNQIRAGRIVPLEEL